MGSVIIYRPIGSGRSAAGEFEEMRCGHQTLPDRKSSAFRPEIDDRRTLGRGKSPSEHLELVGPIFQNGVWDMIAEVGPDGSD
jgi:hypothetical protein